MNSSLLNNEATGLVHWSPFPLLRKVKLKVAPLELRFVYIHIYIYIKTIQNHYVSHCMPIGMAGLQTCSIAVYFKLFFGATWGSCVDIICLNSSPGQSLWPVSSRHEPDPWQWSAQGHVREPRHRAGLGRLTGTLLGQSKGSSVIKAHN